MRDLQRRSSEPGERRGRRRAAMASVTVLGGLVAAGCGYSAPPVPVEGDELDLAVLAGEWHGEYGSGETGRSGSIFFRLEAGEDTARGDVLMVPPRPPRVVGDEEPWRRDPLSLATGPEAAPQVVPIRFVRVEGRTVSGELATYRDPECGCELETTFIGHVEDGHIDGTFTSLHVDGGEDRSGWWRATRRGPVVATPVADAAAEAGGAREAREPAAPERRDSLPLEGPGLAELDLADEGRALFSSLGCDRCHTGDPVTAEGPELDVVTEHRSFRWIYHMILNPDSMLAEDPTARALYADFRLAMPDRDASPWQALALYEYLWREAAESTTP